MIKKTFYTSRRELINLLVFEIILWLTLRSTLPLPERTRRTCYCSSPFWPWISPRSSRRLHRPPTHLKARWLARALGPSRYRRTRCRVWGKEVIQHHWTKLNKENVKIFWEIRRNWWIKKVFPIIAKYRPLSFLNNLFGLNDRKIAFYNLHKKG